MENGVQDVLSGS